MLPRLGAVNYLRDRYFEIDRLDRKIQYGRYERQTLPALPACRQLADRWQLTSEGEPRGCYQFVSAEGAVAIEPKDPLVTPKALLAMRLIRFLGWEAAYSGKCVRGTKCRLVASNRLV
jgi:hypothetical protein